MTKTEQGELDDLLEIADEDDSPLDERALEFLRSLDGRRERTMTSRQGDWFDDLVRKHLRG